jgi:segregation and condensation protein B
MDDISREGGASRDPDSDSDPWRRRMQPTEPSRDPDAPDPLPAGPDDVSDAEIEAFVARQKAEAPPEPAPELHDPAELARVLMALLVTSKDGASLLRLAQACNSSQESVGAGLERLHEELRKAGMPLEVHVAGEIARLLTVPDVDPYLQRMRGIKKADRLSPAALETLAVIAYKGPVIRAEIEAIRGVKAGPMLRMLLEHKLIQITGRADVPGRPLQYGITPTFLDRFGLHSSKELPSIKELKALG